MTTPSERTNHAPRTHYTATEMLAELVAFDTVSRHSNLALIEFIERYLTAHGVESWRVENDDGSKSNLLARIGPAVEGGVVLSGHTDVVPVDGQPWSTDPFTLTARDGKLYARGSCDMKGFIACALAAVPQWTATELSKPVWLAFSYDEEIGCLGAPRMIERLVADFPRPAVVIVGEPTLMQPVTQQKGITSLKTVVHGVESHSSQVDQGISAIHVAARLVTRIEEIMAEMVSEGETNANFNVAHSSLHVGRIQGGTAINIMARECSFEWEIRHLPEQGFDAVFARFDAFSQSLEQELKARDSRFAIETTPLTHTVPGLAGSDNRDAIALCQRLLGERETQAVAYATEAGQFQNAGLEALICGPGSITQAHQPDEFISEEQLAQGEAFMQRLGECLQA
ncbi:acetylornithine deacetylase [Salinicola endophyticus]|uniref:acetylornithine deacetylase n=1 Tax=Salinicola endophyticus TaxID=1949083 RepID=UPI000DA143F3|nr:acetylornithine deacetylase [Salinicola endophyticus]